MNFGSVKPVFTTGHNQLNQNIRSFAHKFSTADGPQTEPQMGNARTAPGLRGAAAYLRHVHDLAPALEGHGLEDGEEGGEDVVEARHALVWVAVEPAPLAQLLQRPSG